MPTFEFIQESPTAGVGFVYKSTTSAYYFDGVVNTQITDPNYPATTVPGIVYLDGTYYVMSPDGVIHGSAINDPLTWQALNVISCQGEPDQGIALIRQLNLIVAFNAYSTEFFYDAGNPTGSPLLPYQSAFIELGCASGTSIAQTENEVYFMGVSKQKGRSIYRLVGTSPQIVSTPYIDRLLNFDNLSSVTAHCIRIAGHSFYILYLGDSQITLVYDATAGLWAKWTVSNLSTPKSIENIVWADGYATVTVSSHGYNDGDLVEIAGTTPADYSGQFTITVITDNTFTYPLAANPGPLTVNGTVANYVQSPFSIASYTYSVDYDVIQDSTTGFIYLLDNNTYEDNSKPIDVLIRTFKFDGGNNKFKYFSYIELIGDKYTTTTYVRYTNDDYKTYSYYRPINMDLNRSKLERQGRARRRAYEIRHHDNSPLRIEAIETEVNEGIR